MKFRYFLFITTFLTISSVFAQDGDQILSRYFEETGGLATWKNLHSMSIKASFEQGGMTFNAIIYRKQPDLSRTEIEVQGNNIIQAYDGETGWIINPMAGTSAPQKMPAEMMEAMKEEKFESDLIDYAEKGNKVDLEGTEMIDGIETYKIRLTKKNEDVEYYFFDTETYLPILERRPIKMGPMKDQESETYISNYRKVGDLVMPHVIEVMANGQLVQKLVIAEYIFNEDLDDSLFKFPEGQ